jgi:hypothetical protein
MKSKNTPKPSQTTIFSSIINKYSSVGAYYLIYWAWLLQSSLIYTGVADKEANFRALEMARLNELCLASKFRLAERPSTLKCMGKRILSLTSMVITHVAIDDSEFVRLALM